MKISDDRLVFNTFWQCSGFNIPQASWRSLIWQLGWGSEWKPNPRLKKALDYLLAIKAIEKVSLGQYKVTQAGMDQYGTPRRVGDSVFSGITYEVPE